MNLPDPTNTRGIDLGQAHVRLVRDVLGLDDGELIRAFTPLAHTGRPSRTPAFVVYRARVILALRHARVNGDGLSYNEIASVTGFEDHNTMIHACHRAERAGAVTQLQIDTLRRG